MAENDSKRKMGLLAVGSLLVLIFVIGFRILRHNQVEKNTPSNPGLLTKSEFKTAIAALSATEEAEFETALSLWQELRTKLPEDFALKLNESVTVLKWIDTLDSKLSNPKKSLSEQEQADISNEISEAYQLADRLVNELDQSAEYDQRVPLIKSAVLNSKANKASAAESASLRRQAAEVLLSAAEEHGSSALLAGGLDETLTFLGSDADDLKERVSNVLLEGYKSSPRNLFLLQRAILTLLEAQDPRLEELLDPTVELSRSMWSTQQRLIDRLKPHELVKSSKEAIANDEWNSLVRIRLWMNVLAGMPSFNPDNKAVTPDPLVLLDTNVLQRFKPSNDDEKKTTPAKTKFVASSSSATDAVWYDFDFDLKMELIAVDGKSMRFIEEIDGELSVVNELSLPLEASQLTAVDLFAVQAPRGPKLPETIAELMLEQSASQMVELEVPGTAETIQKVPERHDQLREILAFGEKGITCVSVSTNEDDSPNFEILEAIPGLEEFRNVQSITPADIESDGDLDLLIVADGKIAIMQNNGNRTFNPISQYSTLPPPTSTTTRAIACDVDRDLDCDFLVLVDGKIGLLQNLQHSQFRFQSDWLVAAEDFQPATYSDFDFGDFDGNGSWDLVGTTANKTDLLLTRIDTSVVQLKQLIALPWGGNTTVVSDFNNDSILDILYSADDSIELRYGQSDLSFSGATLVAKEAAQRLDVIDADYDGQLDVAVTTATSSLSLCKVEGLAIDMKHIDVRLAGINDVNGGGRVNHYGVGSTLEIWAGSRLQSRFVRSPITHIGLGDNSPNNLRVIFPHGLTQNVQNPSANMLIEEKQVLRGSCPYIYGWDGSQFQLITDALWNAPLGLQTSRGEVLPDRRWENLLLPGQFMQPVDGHIELRLTEELWEVAYFDHVRLSYVDHPASTSVYTNEKVGPAELAQHRIFSVDDRLNVQSAINSQGKDVTTRVKLADQEFATPFATRLCQGLCSPHFIELNFEDGIGDEDYLYLTGWLYPTDTSLNIGISQNQSRNPPEPPSLWVIDEEGKWVCSKPFIGFPGGKTKTIVVPLAGVFRGEERRLRIAGSQEIYWDEIFIAPANAKSLSRELVEVPLKVESAQLRYRGFSALLPREADQPHWFDYQDVTKTPQWPRLNGPFTRYGEVTQLLAEDDDQLVVLTSGDEIRVRFELPSEALPQGWQRDYILYSTGWDKDADINTLAGQGSLPLPFRAQKTYPPPRDQQSETNRVRALNARTLTRLPAPSDFIPIQN